MVRRAVVLSDGKVENACSRSLTAPCWDICPRILVFLDREKTMDTTRVKEAVEPCWLCVTRIGIMPASKTAWHRFATCSSSLKGSGFAEDLEALA